MQIVDSLIDPILNPTLIIGEFEWREPITTLTDSLTGFVCIFAFIIFFTSCKSNIVNFDKIIHQLSFNIYLEVNKIKILDINIKNIAGAAAASNKSCEAYTYAFVAKVSKLNGLIIKVIGNSLTISIERRITTKKIEFFKKGK